jgi:hypothetical protein
VDPAIALPAAPVVRRESVRALLIAAGLLLLCLPSLALVWNFRDLPHFGVIQDDSLYFQGAKSFAEGSSYRITSLPAQPYQTKYPPLYPLYLSLAWRMNPAFPANLTPALLLSWLAMPAILLLTWFWCRRQGFGDRRTWLLLALIGLNPYIIFFACNIGSELFFLVLALAAMLAAERSSKGRWWPLIAGAIAGAAYLARTAGLALLPAGIVFFLLRRRPRAALWFTAGMLPAIAGWTVWCALHASPGRDIVTLCYTSYSGYQFLNVGWDNFGSVLWQNFDALLESIGSMVFPQVLQGLASKVILQPLAVFMVLGIVRMVRRGEALLYALFAAFSAVMLLVWHYPPNQRFILPLTPLLLAGFCCEMSHLAQALRNAFRHRDRSQRVIAYAFTGLLTLMLATAFGLQVYLSGSAFPELFREDRDKDRAYDHLYGWIAANVPAGANLMWERDVVLHLATGRHATSRPIPSRQWYASGFDRDMDYYRNIDEFAREHQLGYIVMSTAGSYPKTERLRTVAANPRLEKIHEESGGVVFRVTSGARAHSGN